MSDELIDSETPALPPPKKKLSVATILGLLLLLVAASGGFYLGNVWRLHTGRINRLRAMNGTFMQLERRDSDDEFAVGQRPGRREDAPAPPGQSGTTKKEPDEPTWYDKYVTEMFPKPVQVVDWRNTSMTAEDAELIMGFEDAELLFVNCEEIEAATIAKFLSLPKLRRLNVAANKIDIDGLASWKTNDKFVMLSLVCPKWDGEKIQEVETQAESNPVLKNKVSAAAALRPSFGGG